jgi:polar amino acid transport system permease protein
MIDYELIYKSLPSLLHGFSITLQIAFVSIVIGLTVGTVLSLLEASKAFMFRYFVHGYITLFRGTPMLVQILFVYYSLPQMGVMIDPFWAASLSIGLNSGAYISQIIKSGIQAVSYGQIEAAYTLGLNYFSTMRYIVLPQAFRIAMPSLGNEIITLVKDSSLASIIGVMELTKEASIIRSRTYDAFSILLAISIIYLLTTVILSYCMNKINKSVKADVTSI